MASKWNRKSSTYFFCNKNKRSQQEQELGCRKQYSKAHRTSTQLIIGGIQLDRVAYYLLPERVLQLLGSTAVVLSHTQTR